MEKTDEIMGILNDFLRMDDVLACMVAKRGLDGLVPRKIKITDFDLWKTVNDATSDLFMLIDKLYGYGVGRVNIELGKYTVIMVPISKQLALIVITPSLANIGLLDVEVENTRRQVMAILERK